jgi:hypothetical protein
MSGSRLSRKMGDGKSYASLRGDDAGERERPGVPVPAGASYSCSSGMVAWTRTEAEGPDARERWPGTNFCLRTTAAGDEPDGSRLSCRRSDDRRDESVVVESAVRGKATGASGLKVRVGGRTF